MAHRKRVKMVAHSRRSEVSAQIRGGFGTPDQAKDSGCQNYPFEFPAIGTIDDLARYTKRSIPSCRRDQMFGRGPRALKISRHLRFRREDVLLWLKSCERGNQPEAL